MDSSEISRVIEMAWEDRTPFDAIKESHGLSEDEVKALMRRELKYSSYKMWRKRVTGRKTKHIQKKKNTTARRIQNQPTNTNKTKNKTTE